MATSKTAAFGLIAACLLACYLASVTGQGSCPYVVREGDTFLKVSRKPANPIPVDSIIALNPGVNPEALKVGQTIQVPCNGGGSTTKPGKPAPGTVPPGSCPYVVREGDTFLKISRKPANPIPMDEITTRNPGVNPEALKVGQTIKVPC